MKSTALKHRILLIISGLCIAFLLGEAFFRIGGFIVSNAMHKNNKEKSNAYKILCIGDSSTYGLEASDVKRFSYPAQLQTILEERIPDKKFEVINLGMPGMNSSQVLNRFERNIIQYRPDTVIIMIGINDPWNFEESNILKFYKMSTVKELYMRAILLFNRSRLFQFLKLIFLSNEFKEMKIPDFNNETISKAVEFYQEDPDRARAFNNMIFYNIAELKRLAGNNQVDIIFMKYHNIGWGRPEIVLNKVYAALKVSVVDNESIFRKAAGLGLNVRGRDGWHPNDLGYLLIAKSVYNQMVFSGVIEGKPIKMVELK